MQQKSHFNFFTGFVTFLDGLKALRVSEGDRKRKFLNSILLGLSMGQKSHFVSLVLLAQNFSDLAETGWGRIVQQYQRFSLDRSGAAVGTKISW